MENAGNLSNVSDAGLDYDTTVSFADTPGFHCGVCYEFPVFNVLTRQKLPLIERPLVVMDCTVTGARCMRPDLDAQKAINTIFKLSKPMQAISW